MREKNVSAEKRVKEPGKNLSRKEILAIGLYSLFMIGVGGVSHYILSQRRTEIGYLSPPLITEGKIQLPELRYTEKTTFEDILRQGNEIGASWTAVTATDGVIIGGNSVEVAILTKMPENPREPRSESFNVINHLFFAPHLAFSKEKTLKIGDKVNGKIVFLPMSKVLNKYLPVAISILMTGERIEDITEKKYLPLIREVQKIEINREPQLQGSTLL